MVLLSLYLQYTWVACGVLQVTEADLCVRVFDGSCSRERFRRCAARLSEQNVRHAAMVHH